MSTPWTISEHNAADYLRMRGWVGADETLQVRRLSGGVSNEVFRIAHSGGPDFVLKQARNRLRVEELWECDPERIWRERDVLRACREILDRQTGPAFEGGFRVETPEVLFEAPEDFTLVISAAPEDHVCWKDTLLAGKPSPSVAAACGRLLAQLHIGAWEDEQIGSQLADRRFFIDLRVDPYYRHVARSFAEHRDALLDLEKSLESHRKTLVHGDFSPKNLLASESSLMLIDFEVGHFGDPAFDIGFFLTHLTLKCCWAGERRRSYAALIHAFWQAYCEIAAPGLGANVPDANESLGDQRGCEFQQLCQRSALHLAACGLARLDGKSTVDYLPPQMKPVLRGMFGDWLHTDHAANPACRDLPAMIEQGLEACIDVTD